MAERNRGKYRRKPPKKGIPGLVPVLVIFLCTALVIGGLELFYFRGETDDPQMNNTSAPVSTTEPTTEPTEPPIEKIATAKISSMGDVLMHLPVINAGASGDGTYDFSGIFTYLKAYASGADYAVANLETTLYGTGKPYSGYPLFNCPDEIVDGAMDAGFDMFLTANNHSNDTGSAGLLRTTQVIDERGMDRLGIVRDAAEKNYVVKELNGIKVGMICYTYETDNSAEGVALNGCPLTAETKPLVNAFSYGELDTFYAKLSGQLDQMKADGAEGTILYIHWGDEYQLSPNQYQKTIAQKVCDMGFDVIVGGHPHVIQPVELLSSTVDPDHKTVCLYSMGNAVSNQRRQNMNMNTGHTEDGILFNVTFAKYSDGTVLLESVDAVPLWVNMYTSATTGRNVYEILPLDSNVADWRGAMDLTDNSEASARAAYDRTIQLVKEGIDASQNYLDSVVKPDSEEYRQQQSAAQQTTPAETTLPNAA